MQQITLCNTNQELKQAYVNHIIELMKMCDDISLLDLIEKLLKKSI